MSLSNTLPDDMSQSHPSPWGIVGSDHPPPTATSEDNTTPVEDHNIPATLAPLYEDTLDLEDISEDLIPSSGDDGPHSPLMGNSVLHASNPWTWTQDTTTPNVFQSLATQGLIDPIPKQTLPLKALTHGYVLPLTPHVTLASSLDVEVEHDDTPCHSAPTPPDSPVYHQSMSSLSGDPEEDLFGVGHGLLLDRDQARQVEQDIGPHGREER